MPLVIHNRQDDQDRLRLIHRCANCGGLNDSTLTCYHSHQRAIIEGCTRTTIKFDDFTLGSHLSEHKFDYRMLPNRVTLPSHI